MLDLGSVLERLEMSVVQTAEARVDASFAVEARKAFRDTGSKMSQLHRAVASGSGRRIKAAQENLLKSFSSRLCCIVLSVEKKPKPLTYTATELREMANEIDAFSDPGEPVRAYAKTKSLRGDWRPICAFGPRRKALQTLVNFLLIAKFGPHPLDYMAQGRGAEVAADRITQFIDDGINHFVVADIEACFRSVKQGELAARLGFPPMVVRHCLLIGEDVPVMLPSVLPVGVSYRAFSEAVRQGLPQGARSSNRVISLLLGPELRSLTSDDRVILYGDDIAVPADTRDMADTLAKTLSELLEVHSAGPFRLKRCSVEDARPGFNFLKYKFRRDRFTGRSYLRPSDLSYHRFGERVRGIVRDEPREKVYPAVMAYRGRWLTSFRRYQPNWLALNLLWQSTIAKLNPELEKRWDFSRRRYASLALPPVHPVDDWLDRGSAGFEALSQ